MPANWSYPDAELVLTVDEAQRDRNRWLEVRRQGIGGSDMATLMGDGKYADSTEWDLWLDKTARVFELESSMAMKYGTLLEQPVADEWSRQTALGIRRVGTLRSKAHPTLFANCDRLTDDGGGLEVKTGNSYVGAALKKLPPDVIPRHFYWQMVTCLAVTGRSHWYLRGVFGNTLEWDRVLQREDCLEDIEKVFEVAPAWYLKHVIEDEPPILGAPAELTAAEKGSTVEASSPLIAWHDQLEWRQLRKQKKEIEGRLDELKAEFKAELSDAQILTIKGVPMVRMQSRIGNNIFQKAKLVTDHPEINLDDYYKRNKTSYFPVLIGDDSDE